MKMKMVIWMVESLLVIVFLAAHSHQLDQRQALQNLFAKSRQSHHDMSGNYQSFYTDQNLVIRPQESSQRKDLIHGGLPGQPTDVEFAQYSGYVTVNSSTGRALFYYFAEAAANPEASPLILWLNGGPGCSSLGYGAMKELGPFGVNPDGKTLYRRPYAWNQVANTLFLESPAGVGFSYSNTTSDYNSSGDKRTAEDSYAFLVNWFERFPQYKYRDFYVIGESYAGHYIPELADTILYHKRKSEAAFINLKGIMVGNGLIDDATDYKGRYDYMWTHALISDQTHDGIGKFCKFSIEAPYSPQCHNFIDKAYEEIGNIDTYNIYAPICLQSSSKRSSTRYVGQEESDQTAGYDPCSDDYIHTYLNSVDAQRALHVANATLPYLWSQCSDTIHALWRDQVPSMFPFYREFIHAGLQVLIYSGDVDSVLPVTSTRNSINGLKLSIETSWHPWMRNNEVAGYSVIYKGLTFATVRGAGHEVPSFQPARALTMLKSFLAGKPLPKAPDS